VPAVREAVREWRASGYKKTSATTATLLGYWFHTDHRLPNGDRFRYHDAQRHAIETLVYLYEVVGIKRHRDLLTTFAPHAAGAHVLENDDFARYCIKMATGSGKTKVISLAVAWQYLNAVAEGRDDYARTFLLIAPNIIVLERLATDFSAGRIFRTDPVIPPELATFWDLDCYVRAEGERATSTGALYLTNIQQLYPRQEAENDETAAMTAVLGPRPPGSLTDSVPFGSRIDARSAACMVINDEAHHTHDEGSQWSEVIRAVHESLPSGLIGQLDFSATPRYAKGGLFTWTVFDYPLKQAIIDGLVKRPMKGIAKGIAEQPSEYASTKYRAYLTAGVERWREYRVQLAPTGKKPVLFVMMNSTADADDVGEYMRTKYPEEFGKGAIEGVAGPEAANNAAFSGVLVPLLTLGIPTSATAAILLAAFQIYNLQPGPQLFQNEPDLVWALIASLYIGNVMLLVLNLPLIRLWVKILAVPRSLLYAAILVFATLGVYSLANSLVDVLIMYVIGVIGFFMRRYDFPVGPMILGVILGPMLESQFRRALQISQGDMSVFVTRPISAILLLSAVIIVALPYVPRLFGRGQRLVFGSGSDD